MYCHPAGDVEKKQSCAQRSVVQLLKQSRTWLHDNVSSPASGVGMGGSPASTIGVGGNPASSVGIGGIPPSIGIGVVAMHAFCSVAQFWRTHQSFRQLNRRAHE